MNLSVQPMDIRIVRNFARLNTIKVNGSAILLCKLLIPRRTFL